MPDTKRNDERECGCYRQTEGLATTLHFCPTHKAYWDRYLREVEEFDRHDPRAQLVRSIERGES